MRIREDLKRKLAERKVHITNVNDSSPCDAIPGDKRPRVLSYDDGFNPHHPIPDDEDSNNFHDKADDEDSHNFHNTADDDNSTDSSYVEEGSFLTTRKSKRKIRGKLYSTTTRLRMLMESTMKEGVENNVVTQDEQEATMRTLGHSASTVNRYYLPNDRYKLDYNICVVILINLWFLNRLNEARKATAALDRVYQSGQEEEEEEEEGEEKQIMNTESESEEEETAMESEEEGEEEEHIMNKESESEEEETAMESEEEGVEGNEIEAEKEAQGGSMEGVEEECELEEEEEQEVAQGGSMEDVKEECEWEEEEEEEVATPQLQPIWGKLHPDKRSPTDGLDIRVPWSEAERGYVRKWIVGNPDVPVRLLYEDVCACNVARDIFHSHHVELDKISYMFKLIRKTVL